MRSTGMSTRLNLIPERNAFFDASLRLVKQGRFQGASMSEIAFVARISARTVPYVFESRDELVSELGAMIISQITKKMNDVFSSPGSFKQRFFNGWTALYEYYSEHPNVIAFMEQFGSLSQTHVVYPGNARILIDFFRMAADFELSTALNAETLAYVFHDNILSAARMRAVVGLNGVSLSPEQSSWLLWNSLFTFPAAIVH